MATPSRRDYLKALAALPIATRVGFGPRMASISQPIVDLRDRRAANGQELVVLMTPASSERGDVDFDPRERAEQAERLAEMLAIDGNAETYIEWHHDHDEYWRRYRYEFVLGRIAPRAFVATTLAPASHLDLHVFSMADAWVEMTSHDAGDVRLIEWDAFEDAVYAEQAGEVEF